MPSYRSEVRPHLPRRDHLTSPARDRRARCAPSPEPLFRTAHARSATGLSPRTRSRSDPFAPDSARTRALHPARHMHMH
eukprot:scaffold85594_cov46-Phaeocystis_antarctica.AAC.1